MAQLLLLVWKNFVQQKRKPITTLLQIVFPVLFMVIMALLRTTSKDTYKCEGTDEVAGCEWPAFSVTSPELPLLAVIAKTYDLTNVSSLPPDIEPGKYQVRVAYSPSNAFTDSATANALDFLSGKFPFIGPLQLLQFDGYSSEEAMLDAVMQEANNETIRHKKYFAAVTFNPDISNASKDLQISIRMDSDPRVQFSFIDRDSDPEQGARKNWLTDLTFPMYIRQGPRASEEFAGGQPYYYSNMFLHLQHSLTLGLIQAKSNNSVLAANVPDVQMRRFPFPRYLENDFIAAVQFGLPLLIFLAYILTALVLVSDIVREKERRLKVSGNWILVFVREQW